MAKIEGNWLKGKGTAGLEAEAEKARFARRGLPEGTRLTPPADAESAVASVVASATSGQEKSVLAALKDMLEFDTSPRTLAIADVAAKAGVSKTFMGFMLGSRIARINAEGIAVENVTAATFSARHVTVSAAAPAAAPATPKVTVRAKKAKEATPEASTLPETPVAEAVAAAAAPTVDDADYFYFDPVKKAKILAWLKARRPFWISGPTGTGKSEFISRLCESLGITYLRQSANGESAVDGLLGHYTLRGGETVWVEGALGKCMENGWVLIVEEGDSAAAEVNLAFQRVLEVRPGKAASFYNDRNGREYVAKDGFTVGFTGNSTGGGDHTGLYAGVQTQNAAFRNRFVFEHMDYPEPAIEVEILVKRTKMPKTFAEKLVSMAKSVRDKVTSGEMFTPISTRSLVTFGLCVNEFTEAGMSKNDAVREAMLSTVIYGAANPSDAEALRGLVQREFGVK